MLLIPVRSTSEFIPRPLPEPRLMPRVLNFGNLATHLFIQSAQRALNVPIEHFTNARTLSDIKVLCLTDAPEARRTNAVFARFFSSQLVQLELERASTTPIDFQQSDPSRQKLPYVCWESDLDLSFKLGSSSERLLSERSIYAILSTVNKLLDYLTAYKSNQRKKQKLEEARIELRKIEESPGLLREERLHISKKMIDNTLALAEITAALKKDKTTLDELLQKIIQEEALVDVFTLYQSEYPEETPVTECWKNFIEWRPEQPIKQTARVIVLILKQINSLLSRSLKRALPERQKQLAHTFNTLSCGIVVASRELLVDKPTNKGHFADFAKKPTCFLLLIDCPSVEREESTS